jgi:mRNA interferase MazF
MIDQIRAIDNKRLIKMIGLASTEIHEKIKENLKIVFDLE